MGLAASQARLLTITSRKSDCEYESMRLSHQKIALSRQMTEISNEYQEALNQTNLYYDFYGTGDKSNPLTYSLLMTPSALNDYLPTLITNQQGRVVLDAKLAAAARSAGIPQEGLNSTAADDVRNKFVEALFEQGIISKKTKDAIQASTYNPVAGLGNTDMTTVNTVEGDLNTLLEYIRDRITTGVDLDTAIANNTAVLGKDNALLIDSSADWQFNSADLTLYNLLSNSDQYTVFGWADDEDYYSHTGIQAMADYMMGTENSSGVGFLDQIYEQFATLLDTGDGKSGMALEYALNQMKNMFDYTKGGYELGTNDNSAEYLEAAGGTNIDSHYKRSRNHDAVRNHNTEYIGITHSKTKHDWWTNGAAAALNLNNIVKSFLTYFAEYMEGVATSDYHVEKGNIKNSNLVTDDLSYVYTINTGTSVSADDARMGLFYDTLFNQLCTNGWTENAEVTDQEYLQEMLKSGMMYISTCNDDGYYYQENYSINTFIKEFSDDSKIAAAEAKYTTMKSKLTNKEDELDLKMKNLDTEISSLTTEYDSVKSVISKNIEKSFKRYNA